MKKAFSAVLVVSVLGLFSFQHNPKVADPKLKVEAPLSEWSKHFNKLEVVRQVVDNSSLDHQSVKFVTKTIDSLELLIGPQLQAQLDSNSTKPKK